MTEPRVAVIVLAWNGVKFLDACLAAVFDQRWPDLQIIVVDNASTDDSVAVIQKHVPPVQLIGNEYNLGYAGGNNVGLHATDADIVVLLNQDTVVRPGWLRAIVDTFEDPSVGIVGCKALYADGKSLQHAGAILEPGNAVTRHIGRGEQDHGQYDVTAEPDYVTGAAFAIHRRVLDRLGGLDEAFYPAFYEEADYCWRARRCGFRVIYQPKAVLMHHETSSIPQQGDELPLFLHRNRVRFVLRNWSSNELREFEAAERQTIHSSLGMNDLILREQAYGENMLALPLLALTRKTDPSLAPFEQGEGGRLIRMLQSLREETSRRIVDLAQKRNADAPVLSGEGTWPSTASIERELADLSALAAELQSRRWLEKLSPRPRWPVIGYLITGLRRLWSLVWLYPTLLQTLEKQAAWNARAGQLLGLSLVGQELAHRREQIWMAEQVTLAENLQRLIDYIDSIKRHGDSE